MWKIMDIITYASDSCCDPPVLGSLIWKLSSVKRVLAIYWGGFHIIIFSKRFSWIHNFRSRHNRSMRWWMKIRTSVYECKKNVCFKYIWDDVKVINYQLTIDNCQLIIDINPGYPALHIGVNLIKFFYAKSPKGRNIKAQGIALGWSII